MLALDLRKLKHLLSSTDYGIFRIGNNTALQTSGKFTNITSIWAALHAVQTTDYTTGMCFQCGTKKFDKEYQSCKGELSVSMGESKANWQLRRNTESNIHGFDLVAAYRRNSTNQL